MFLLRANKLDCFFRGKRQLSTGLPHITLQLICSRKKHRDLLFFSNLTKLNTSDRETIRDRCDQDETDCAHGQTLAKRTRPGQSFQVQMRAGYWYVHLPPSLAKQPILKLKTKPKQLLVYHAARLASIKNTATLK